MALCLATFLSERRPGVMRLPDGPNRVLSDHLIGCQQNKAMDERLADQHAVEGVLVQIRQFGKLVCRFFLQGQRRNTMPGAHRRNKSIGRFGKPQPPEGVLDDYFPDRNAAQINAVTRVLKTDLGRG